MTGTGAKEAAQQQQQEAEEGAKYNTQVATLATREAVDEGNNKLGHLVQGIGMAQIMQHGFVVVQGGEASNTQMER